VQRPVANSLSTDLYGLIPNSTDVNVFAERSAWTILNFAIIGNETRYHSAGDTLSSLDRRSLQHMGDQVLSVSRALLDHGVPPVLGNRIYADVAGRAMVTLPLAVGAVLIGVLLLYFAIVALNRQALARATGAVLAGLIASGAIAFAAQYLMGLFRTGEYWRGHQVVTLSAIYATAIFACTAALLAIARQASAAQLRSGYWLAFTLVGAAISFIAPGGAIYFLAPPLVAGVGMMLGRWREGLETVAAVLAALILFITFGPALGLFEELLSSGPLWVFASLGALVVLPWLVELSPRIDGARPALVILAIVALAGWIASAMAPAYSENRQQRFVIDYMWDADSHQANWSVNSDGARLPDGFGWEHRKLAFSNARRWLAHAPAVPVEPPSLVLVNQRSEGTGRHLWLRIRANGASTVTLIAPHDSALHAAGVGAFIPPFGHGTANDDFVVRCAGRSCDGAILEVVSSTTAPIEFTLVGTRTGWPEAVSASGPRRPPLARPQYSPDSTITFAHHRL
jgi:hypothetical protein